MHEDSRHLHLRGALGAVRTEMFDGREHLVVPVIALMDGVIHAVNASTPERVTTATLAKAAASWNGRPLVLGHPTKNGRQCSANDPSIKNTHHFGTIFNSRMAGPKLLMDAYVDPVLAEKIGGSAFITKLRNGEQVEVSVGAYVQTKDEEGTYNGRSYKGTWLETHGDHLAFLPGGKGACSIEMGCGAHRAAEMYLVTAEGFEVLGGAGSGNFGHSGRPGQVGGSGGSGAGGGGEIAGSPEHISRLQKEVSDLIANTREREASLTTPGKKLGANEPVKPGTVVAFHTPTADEVDSEFTVVEDRDTRVLVQDRDSYWDNQRLRPTTAYSKEDLRRVDNPKRAVVPGGFRASGGAGSGNFGHAGRPGQVGGSGGSSGGGAFKTGDRVTISDKHWDKRLHGQQGTIKSTGTSAEGKPTHYVKTDGGRGQFVHSDELTSDNAGGKSGAKMAKLKDAITSSKLSPVSFDENDDGSVEIQGPSFALKDHQKEAESRGFETHLIERGNAPASLWIEPHPGDADNSFDPEDFEGPAKAKPATVPGSKDFSDFEHGFKVKRGLASRDCSVCGGTGQIKNEQKQEDCPSCGGSGKIKTAEDYDGSAVEEAQMKKVEAIKALTACPCSGFVPADAKELEAFSEERLTAMAEFVFAKKKTDEELAAEKEAEAKKLKDAEAAITELKAAAAKAPTEDEYLAKAPESIRTLVADKKAQDARIKTDLVAQLKVAAAGAFTEAELNEKPIAELIKLAQMAKVEAADYSGRNIPASRNAETSTYTPPDPYAAGLKALQGKTTVN